MYDEGFGVNLPGYEFFNFFMYLSGTKVGELSPSVPFEECLRPHNGRLVS